MILDTKLYYHVNSYDFIPNRVTFITSTLVQKLLMLLHKIIIVLFLYFIIL